MSWICLVSLVEFVPLLSSLRIDFFPKTVFQGLESSPGELCYGFKTHLETMFSNEILNFMGGEKKHTNCECKSAVNKQKQCFPQIVGELYAPCASVQLGMYQMAGQQWPMRMHTGPLHISCITTCSLPHAASHIDHEYISLENMLYADDEFGNCPAWNSCKECSLIDFWTAT